MEFFFINDHNKVAFLFYILMRGRHLETENSSEIKKKTVEKNVVILLNLTDLVKGTKYKTYQVNIW